MKLFKNAYLPTSSSALKKVNILFDQQIIKISKDDISTEEPVEEIDLEGALLLPGAVDIHCHIQTNLRDYSVHLETLTKEALTGGWTSLADMSYHTDFPCFGRSNLKKIIPLIDKKSYCDIALWGHVDVDEYPYYNESAQELWESGLVGILLMNPSPNPQVKTLSFTDIMDLFLDIYDSDTMFAFNGFDLEEEQDYTPQSQSSAIKKLLRRMQENPIHLPIVKDFEVIEFINTVSKRSDISFSLCLSDFMDLMSQIKRESTIPLGFEERWDEFYELLRTNKIYLFSNNAAVQHSSSEPSEDVFSGTDYKRMRYSYQWILSELWKKRGIPLATCLKMCSENPAKRLGIYPQKGCIEAKSDADFVIFDPEQRTKTPLRTASGEAVELTGAITAVYLKGEKVFDGRKVLSKAGTFLKRTNSPKRRHNKSSWI